MQIRLVNINPLLKENCTTYGSNVYDNVCDSRVQSNVIIPLSGYSTVSYKITFIIEQLSAVLSYINYKKKSNEHILKYNL